MPMKATDIEALIKQSFPDATVEIREVDPLWLIVSRLPDHVLERVRDGLINPPPPPPPDPPYDRFGGLARLATTGPNTGAGTGGNNGTTVNPQCQLLAKKLKKAKGKAAKKKLRRKLRALGC